MKKTLLLGLSGALLCTLLTACGHSDAPQGDADVIKSAEAAQAAKDKAAPEQSLSSVKYEDVMKGYKPQAVQPGVSSPAKPSTTAQAGH